MFMKKKKLLPYVFQPSILTEKYQKLKLVASSEETRNSTGVHQGKMGQCPKGQLQNCAQPFLTAMVGKSSRSGILSHVSSDDCVRDTGCSSRPPGPSSHLFLRTPGQLPSHLSSSGQRHITFFSPQRVPSAAASSFERQKPFTEHHSVWQTFWNTNVKITAWEHIWKKKLY